MNWKKSIISATLSLTLLIPAVAFANNDVNVAEKTRDFGKLRTEITNRPFAGEKGFGYKIELSEEVKAKLEGLKAKLESGEITKEQFHEEMKKLMPEKSRLKGVKRNLHNKIEVPEEVKAKLEGLKAKLESGEITKEQFHEEMKQLMPENFRVKVQRKGSFNKEVK